MNTDFEYYILLFLTIVIPLGIIISLCKFAYWFSEQLFILLKG